MSWTKGIIIVGVILIGCGVSMVLLPILPLKDIKLGTSPSFINDKECQEQLHLLHKQNSLLVFLSNRIDTILDSYTEIESYTYSLKLPDQIIVSITERTPWISTVVDGNSIFIDKQGYILTRNKNMHTLEIDSDQLFIIKGIDINLEDSNHIEEELLVQLIAYESLFKQYLPNQSLLLEKQSANAWQLTIDDHIVVLLGELMDLEEKFKRLNYFISTRTASEYSKLKVIDTRVNHKLLVTYEKK